MKKLADISAFENLEANNTSVFNSSVRVSNKLSKQKVFEFFNPQLKRLKERQINALEDQLDDIKEKMDIRYSDLVDEYDDTNPVYEEDQEDPEMAALQDRYNQLEERMNRLYQRRYYHKHPVTYTIGAIGGNAVRGVKGVAGKLSGLLRKASMTGAKTMSKANSLLSSVKEGFNSGKNY